MKGQWIGNYVGSNNGGIILDLDELESCYQGVAVLIDNDIKLPITFARIKTPSKAPGFELEVALNLVDPHSGLISQWEHLRHKFPNVEFPSSAKTKWSFEGDQLAIGYQTNIGSFGSALLPRSNAQKQSELKPIEINNWKNFKEYALTFNPYEKVFRGQETASNWRLRTHFHRTGRADLHRFLEVDIPELHRNLLPHTTHQFNLENPSENGSFLALAQHHGYPTPLLDWTYSPFVAAYFAYNDLTKARLDDSEKVRIFIFDRKLWSSHFPQIPRLHLPQPHFSILDIAAINNPRMIQQQALVSVTNLDDIESYIRNRENESNSTYLQAVDLPASSRKEVMKELSLMGITAGSLFPGLDGICKQLKERFFDL